MLLSFSLLRQTSSSLGSGVLLRQQDEVAANGQETILLSCGWHLLLLLLCEGHAGDVRTNKLECRFLTPAVSYLRMGLNITFNFKKGKMKIYLNFSN